MALGAEGSAYHDRYNRIARTLITVQDFDIRTESGEHIQINTKPMAIDLQLLAGFSQGLKLDLSAVKFPGGASEIGVAEIKTRIVSTNSARIEFAGEGKCALRDLPRYLVLYTAQPIPLSHALYNVKMSFSPLASLQIDDPSEAGCWDHSAGSGLVCQLANFRQLIPSIPLAVDDTF